MFEVQAEVSQQYTYIERLELVLGSVQQERFSSHLRADLQLLHLGKPLPGEGQRLAALKARSAIAARCQQAFLVSIFIYYPLLLFIYPFCASLLVSVSCIPSAACLAGLHTGCCAPVRVGKQRKFVKSEKQAVFLGIKAHFSRELPASKCTGFSRSAVMLAACSPSTDASSPTT